MSATWGRIVKYTIFGESHGEGVGIVIDNLPPGIKLNLAQIKAELHRRKPGTGNLTTSRKENDEFEILSGFFNDATTGAPLCAFIRNSDQHSESYSNIKELLRPGHADYTGFIKYKGFNDYRGGGHFSGRLTASIVFAGAIAKQILSGYDISILSHVYKIGTLLDLSFSSKDLTVDDYSYLLDLSFPTMDASIGASMQQQIEDIKSLGDSIGGVVEAAVLNLPAGLGSPFFDSLESTISHLVFSIPGVKGIEFGDGFSIAEFNGSAANDQFVIDNDRIHTLTNRCGGILGGISTGMPLIFRAAFKPTSSIALEQSTVNINQMRNSKIKIAGRHDPCIVPRALPVVEAAAAMAILDCMPLAY